jgi:hypothetical protein
MGLLVAMALTVPVLAADDKQDEKKPVAKDKSDSKDKKEVKTDTKDKLVAAGQVQGKLVRIETAQKMLAIQVNVPYPDRGKISYKQTNAEYMVADDLQVLVAHPPIELDEKGRPKKPSAAALKKAIKGPDGGKWFPGDLDSLKQDQVVRAYLKKKKEPPKFGSQAKKDKDLVDENKPIITTICIVSEPLK